MLNLLALMMALCFSHASDLPFWKAKSRLYERIRGGDVIVSVREEKVDGQPRHRLILNGGGQVQAPCTFVFDTALKFEDIARTSGYIRDPKYDEATHTLTFTVSAFFHSTTMKTKLETRREPPPAHIDSTLLDGPMKGFFYRMTFDPVASATCEIGIQGHYAYEAFPIPRIFLQFGLEAVFQGMAKRLRGYVEDTYRAGKSARGHNPMDNGGPRVEEFARL